MGLLARSSLSAGVAVYVLVYGMRKAVRLGEGYPALRLVIVTARPRRLHRRRKAAAATWRDPIIMSRI